MVPESEPSSDRARFRLAFAIGVLALGVLVPALFSIGIGAGLWLVLVYPVGFALAVVATLLRPSDPGARGMVWGALAGTGLALSILAAVFLLGPCGVGLLK